MKMPIWLIAACLATSLPVQAASAFKPVELKDSEMSQLRGRFVMPGRIISFGIVIGLATVVSMAIAFPFCLEQYRGAIHERLQGEYRLRLDGVHRQERAERDLLAQGDGATVTDLRAQLDKVLANGPADPALFAEELASEVTFPLAMMVCEECWEVQIAEFPSQELLFRAQPGKRPAGTL